VEIGVILGDVRTSVSPRDHFDQLLRQVEAAQRNGLTYVTIGHHYLYGDLRWLQPVPTLARLAAELDDHMTLATTIIQAPLYHPVALAEELATLDILARGRLVVGVGAGYRSDEFTALGVDFAQRFAMLDESVGLMKRLWTEDHVTHTGRFWSLEDARPHIRPWQEPHPPLWVGAMGPVGVRRSARLGDGWPVTPETKIPDMVRLLSLYEDERERLGKPQVRHPLRREIVPGRTTDVAFERFEYMAKERLVAYAQRQLATRDAGELTSSFREVAAKETFIGTPAQCVAQIRELAAVVPVDPILVRAQWPHLTGDEVVAYLDDLGRDIVPAVREIEPVERVVRSSVGPTAAGHS
jgi:alkanesulfonate monooxygenase SsuD/methylene tetrahydromethanopterin reductase-like flavin-dependent oxidoreductase (luciferase family)